MIRFLNVNEMEKLYYKGGWRLLFGRFEAKDYLSGSIDEHELLFIMFLNQINE